MANTKEMRIQMVLSAVDKATQVINDSVGKAVKKLDEVQKKAEAISHSAFSVGRDAGALGLAIGAPLVGLVRGAEEAATAQARLAQVFKSMGDESGQAAIQAGILADSLEFEIAVDADKIKETMAKLATFENVIRNNTGSAEVFERATMAALDLAATGFGDAASNAVQLGKALNDPVKGMSALTRAGVTFTAQEQEKIKRLVETGKAFEAQQFMLSAIEKQVGGVAAATANDTDKMMLALAAMGDSFGVMLLPTVQKFTEYFINKAIPAVQRFTERNAPLIEILLKGAAAFAATMLVVSALSFTIGGIAKVVVLSVKAFKLLALTIGFATKAVAVMTKVMLANPWLLAIAAIAAAAYLIYSNWEAIKAFFVRLWDSVKVIFSNALEFIKNLFFKYHPIGIIIAQWDEILAFLGSVKDRFYEAGQNIISSVVDGIKNKAHEAVDAIKGTVQKMRDFLPFSPAKTGPFKDLHRVKIVETIAQAVKPRPLVNAMRAATVAATMAVSPTGATASAPASLSASASAQSGAVSVIYSPVINFNGGEVSMQTREDFAKMLKEHEKELMQVIRQAQAREQRRTF